MRPRVLGFAAAALVAAALVVYVSLGSGPRSPDEVPPSPARTEAVEAPSAPEAGAAPSQPDRLVTLEMGTSRASDEPLAPPERPAESGASPTSDRSATRRLTPAALPEGRGSLTFAVSDPSGRPRADLLVSLRYAEPEGGVAHGTTDASGELRFPRLAPGRYAYRISIPNGPELASAVPLPLGEGEHRSIPVIVTGSALSISGRVRDRSGLPVAGLRVSAKRHRFRSAVDEAVGDGERPPAARTGRDGAFTLRGLGPGEYDVETQAGAGYASATALVQAGTRDLELTVSSALVVEGVVTDSGGRALEGVWITLLPGSSRSARTDPEGRYEIELELDLEPPSLRFFLEGYLEQVLPVTAGPGASGVRLDARLSPAEGSAVSGFVWTDRRVPIVGATVSLRSQERGFRQHVVTVDDGSFLFPAVEAGSDYQLSVTAPGAYGDHLRDRVWVGERGLELEIVLEEVGTGRLAGRMVDVEDAPLAGVRLWLASRESVRSALPLASDERGEFVVEAAPAGDLVFDSRTSPRHTVSGLHLPEGGEREVVLVLDRGGYEVAGVVLGPRGEPVSGVAVTLTWSHQGGSLQSRATRDAVTDAAGTFRFAGLGPGSHDLAVRAPGHRPHRELVDVGSHEARLEVRLEVAGSQ